MILAELVGLVASFTSVLVSQHPQISLQDPQREYESTSHENQERQAKWKDVIHREYEPEDGSEPQQEADYVSMGSESRIKPSFRQSLQKCMWANVGIMLAVIPLGLTAVSFDYFQLKTNGLCFGWESHNNSISISVMRWQLIGEDIVSIPLYIWFPVTLALLVGWKEFQSNYLLTLYIAFAVGATSMIYKSFLVLFGVYRTKMFYRFPAAVLLLAGITYSSIIVGRKFRKVHPSTSYSSFHICFITSISFVTGCTMASIYRNFIVPYYIQQENEINKAIIAAITPAIALIPTAICKYLALRQSSEMIQPDRSFLLAYFLRGAAIGVYRIMQYDCTSTWLFIGLSLLHGFSNVFSKATERLRGKMWTILIACLRRSRCGRRLQLLPLNTPHHRRLKADIEIQNMLFEYIMQILSQAYLVLYQITSFDISPWPVIKGSLIRMAIGLGIDFLFNCISVFIQIHYHDVPMRRVWFKYWKRHVIANSIIVILVVFYFSSAILAISDARRNESTDEYVMKNCTLPLKTGRKYTRSGSDIYSSEGNDVSLLRRLYLSIWLRENDIFRL